jgi:hypothetical protein
MTRTGSFKPWILAMVDQSSGGRMPDLVKLLEQWAVVTAAPIPFAIAVVVAAGLIWLAVGWSYSGVLASKNGQIELQDRQLADYKQKLDGASPDQAKAKIDALERRVRVTVGKEWEPLTRAEKVALTSRLKDIQKTRIQIMYENALGKELAESFLEAFKAADWNEAWITPGSGFGSGVLVGRGQRAMAIKAAIESVTNIKAEVKDPEMNIELMFLGVGINSY